MGSDDGILRGLAESVEPARELDERLGESGDMSPGELADLIEVKMEEVRQRVEEIPRVRPGSGGDPLDDVRSNVLGRIDSTIELNARFRSSGDVGHLTATRYELRGLWEAVQEVSRTGDDPHEHDQRGEADAAGSVADVPVIRGGGDD